MKIGAKTLAFALILIFTLSACSSAAVAVSGVAEENPPKEESQMAKTGDDSMEGEERVSDTAEEQMALENESDELMEDKGEGEMASSETDTKDEEGSMGEDAAMVDQPAFFSAQLVNASTGERFTIDELKGKVILVETLAMWCSNCFKQQSQVKALHEVVGDRQDFISLGLDIDPNENLADLKGYVDSNGFDWLYAVTPVEVAREIGQLYGNQFLNPPSTPMFIIDRHGQVHPLPFGIKSAGQLEEALQPFFNEG